MGIKIINETDEIVVVAQMQVVAANAPNASALFTEQLEVGDSIEMDVNDNSYLVVRPFTPVISEENNDNN